VLITISDKKIGVSSNGTTIDYYNADVVTASDYYPGGMQMPGRKYSNGSSYRYGFNGKENDNDVKGEGNSLDFGARIYDPRIGRWLSVDPMIARMPGVGSYTYVNNNPIRYIDPDGKFLLDVHQRIVQAALSGLSFELITRNRKTEKGGDGLNNDMKNQSFMFGIVGQGTVFSGGITDPDWNQASLKAAHFDQMNYKEIIANVESIKTGASNLVTKYKSGILSEEKFGYEVGKQLHGIADLYSHSNYVELYVQLYGKNNDINSIPTLKEAMADSKYEKFAALLKTDLKTGDYPGKGPGSHKEMNHDVGAGSNYTWLVPETRGKKVTYESKAAEAVATKASKEYLTELKTEIDKK